MFFALRKSLRWSQHADWGVRLVLALSLTLAVGWIAAQSALAAGTPFHRGDVFLAGSGGVQEYSPTGQLQQTVSGTSGASALCFDPSGRHLILPGVGLVDSSGNPLTSNWATVTNGSRCVADGSGHVYVSAGSNLSGYSITKYGIRANFLQMFTITDPEFHALAIALAPDECTIYYGSWGGLAREIDRLNVCTNTHESPFNGDSFVDDLRVLPNWQVLVTDDGYARLDAAPGQSYLPGGPPFPQDEDTLRTMSLDPDGTSFWVCCTYLRSDPTRTYKIFRFDINSGQQLASWPVNPPYAPIAVYGPPLLGNADVERTVDSNTAGTAEAFVTRAGYSGQMSRLHLYVDSSSTASQVVVGIYSNRNGHPGARQEQATITNLRAGSWNYVDVPSPSMPVTAGQRYWIAVLGPSGAGRIRFRDTISGPGSETSSQHSLTALPATWSTGKAWATGNLSAYGS
jgi:hypothetical protein